MAESYITTGALMACTFGTVTCPLVVSPSRRTFLSGKPKANIGDFAPMTNIATFGMCSSLLNPAVASATAAAFGVLTPMPCVPAITTPWMPGKLDVMIEGMPALTNNCRNTCMWAGQISFNNHGQIPIPPPMTNAPIGSLGKMPTGTRAPLTEEERSQMSLETREQYQADLSVALKAGDFEDKMGDVWKKTADDFASKGEQEKAALARQKSLDAFKAGADKRNMAIGDVNERFRKQL